MNQTIIKLKNIGKKYLVSHQKQEPSRLLLGKEKKEKLCALKNINLSIKKGNNIGIIGSNGAGKTTLLKIIAGITFPTEGKVERSGKVVSLMDLEAGFHPDLSGEENIYLNAVLTGMSLSEIKQRFQEIVDFADVGTFLDAPFYTYSDGMKFRLAFSVAVASRCDILVIDEIFAAGDVDFQNKTYEKVRSLQRNGVTTIVSSHIASLVWGFSDSFYELRKGRMSSKPRAKMWQLVKHQEDVWDRKMKIKYR